MFHRELMMVQAQHSKLQEKLQNREQIQIAS